MKILRNNMLYSLFFILLISTTPSHAQFAKKDLGSRDVIINREDTTIYFSVLIHKTNQNIKKNKMYFWYMNGKLGNNLGGYAGYLLHGNYKKFVGDNILVEKGSFHNGLKNGEWIKWHKNGLIKEITNYNLGLNDGDKITYNIYGNALDTLHYKNGEIDTASSAPFIFKSLFSKNKSKHIEKTDNVQEEYPPSENFENTRPTKEDLPNEKKRKPTIFPKRKNKNTGVLDQEIDEP